MNRPTGFLTLASLTRPDGTQLRLQDAVDTGLIQPVGSKPRGWNIPKHEVPMGWNQFTNNGRQALAYALGFRKPISNFVCTQFSIGTGTSLPDVNDSTLQLPLTFYDSNSDTVADSIYKPIGKASFPAPFLIDFEIPIGFTEANGSLITELGLFTGSTEEGAATLIARKVVTGYSKTSSLAPTFVWRLRM